MQSEKTISRAFYPQLHVVQLVGLHVRGDFQGVHPQLSKHLPVSKEEALLSQGLGIALNILCAVVVIVVEEE